MKILPPVQRELWNQLSRIPKHFTLYGGTAIALHLGHRQSIDFDFFTARPINSRRLLNTLTFLKGARVTTNTRDTLNCFTSGDQPVKFSFFSVPQLQRLRPALVAADNNVKVAHMLDLAGTKIKVLQDRAEAKDYIDLDAMIRAKAVTLPLAFACAVRSYTAPGSTPPGSLLALTVLFRGKS